jgi:hypothetical protein
MPLPTKKPDEKPKEFVDRCMADATMNEEFPNASQRRAVCQTQLEKTDRSMSFRFTAGDPFPMRVIEEREDGSGVVLIPLAVEAAEIDLDKTASEAKGKGKLDKKNLEDMVRNFGLWPGPVPIGFHPHQEFEESGGPAPGFINRVFVEEAEGTLALMGEVDLGPFAFVIVVVERAFRGFSVETMTSPETATVVLKGTVLVGGVFTNRPGLDVHFDLAASMRYHSGPKYNFEGWRRGVVSLSIGTPARRAEEGETMTVEELKALLKEGGVDVDELKSLGEDVKSIAAAVAKLTEKEPEKKKEEEEEGEETVEELQASVKALRGDLTKLTTSFVTDRNSVLSERVLVTIKKAIDQKNVPPALFEEARGDKGDPVKWLRSRYANIDAFESFVEALPTTADPSTSSGSGEEAEDSVPYKLSAKAKSELNQSGLTEDDLKHADDPSYFEKAAEAAASK